MSKIKIKELDPKRFNALAGHSRSPAAAYVSVEVGWYSNEDESILGVLLYDTIDDDYVVILMAKDEGRRYRAFDIECSINSIEDAKKRLLNTIKWHTSQGFKVIPHSDKSEGVDLFAPIAPVEKQHPYFTRLTNDSAFVPAKSIINRMMPNFVDVDGNFVQQFQTAGFEARLWELYLNTYFIEEQLFMEREKKSPDFLVNKSEKSVAVEAVIVGRKKENPPKYFKSVSDLINLPNISDEHQNEMPIKFGSPLFSKLQKEYWNLPHVQGFPLVFAIADFHDDQSMIWSSTALINYLYGIRWDYHYDDKHKLII